MKIENISTAQWAEIEKKALVAAAADALVIASKAMEMDPATLSEFVVSLAEHKIRKEQPKGFKKY